MSWRSPGDHRVTGDDRTVGCLDADADVADRLLLAAAVGPGDSGDPDPEVGPETSQRAVGHRLRDLG